MHIKRAHQYRHVEAVKDGLKRMPIHWLKAINHYAWFILPDSLNPLWIGLLRQDGENHYGGQISQQGAWQASVETNYWVKHTPNIFLSESYTDSSVHEAAHALAEIWHTDVDHFYQPGVAFYKYMASNPDEYFACAVNAFLYPECDDVNWNNHDLARTNYDLWEYLNNALV